MLWCQLINYLPANELPPVVDVVATRDLGSNLKCKAPSNRVGGVADASAQSACAVCSQCLTRWATAGTRTACHQGGHGALRPWTSLMVIRQQSPRGRPQLRHPLGRPQLRLQMGRSQPKPGRRCGRSRSQASDGEVAAEARLQMGRSQPKPGFRWGGRSCGLLWRGRRCGRSRSHGRPRRGGRSRSSRRQLATSRCVLGHVAQAQPPLAQRQEPQSLSHAVEHQGRSLVTRSVVR